MHKTLCLCGFAVARARRVVLGSPALPHLPVLSRSLKLRRRQVAGQFVQCNRHELETVFKHDVAYEQMKNLYKMAKIRGS